MAGELKKETQYQRKKRLAAEKAASEAAVASSVNPFAQANGNAVGESITESYDTQDGLHTTQEPSHPFVTPVGSTEFAIPDNAAYEEDWLASMGTTETIAQVGDASGFEPITNGCIFSFNYHESNTVTIRPYPILVKPGTTLTVFRSISTMINDPGEGEPIFNEISPRIDGGRDEVLQKMLATLKSNPDLKKASIRTIDNKYILGQILSNKNNPETVGKFVLLRITYSLSKIFEENGIYESLSELVQPSNARAITISVNYDESRARRIEYSINISAYEAGQDKLVMTANKSFVTVGTDMNAFNAWKAQFYASFKDVREAYTKLRTCDLSKFTPQAADNVVALFNERLREVSVQMVTSANTAADAIAAGSTPQMHAVANPFGSSASGFQAAPSNPFVGNMGGGDAPANPFAAAANPSAGGFGDM